ncbi:MAG TPA: bifunctional ADP-dependent NAD(P)H-hydrate dehydratase/NAD(P)H-hydrate epimerase [Candidatus Latescibacteria bacterium]|nr:bifunctional ADP-dependent NAD(P)H-hydrate dehydratase/NAD(P)H-hydrate epimerase [Candidatus Latescibacterota bacterium]
MLPHLPLVTAEQIAAADQATIREGIPGRELMDRAGRGVWEAAASRYEIRPGSKLLFLCGKGNNGGDGFVAARFARSAGHDTTVVIHTAETDVGGNALYHLEAARSAGVSIQTAEAVGLSALIESVRTADLVFDALLGTGLKGLPRGSISSTICLLRQERPKIVAADVPSGLDPDTGIGEAPDVDLTVTFGALKAAHVTYPGRKRCGAVEVVDIGLSKLALSKLSSRFVAFSRLGPELPDRSPTTHKGAVGRVAVIAGSEGLTGAACLTALAALRGGTGLVTLAIPKSLNDICEIKLTEVMTLPLPEVRKGRCLSLRARAGIRSIISDADAIALGPGLGRHHETAELIRRVVRDLTTPTVLDADGLNAFAGRVDELTDAPAPLILTPHLGEFERLTGTAPEDPLRSAEELSRTTGAVVVLKGAPTIVAFPDGRSYTNLTGNAGMATGGSGDVLTGMIVALLAQGEPPADAALKGVYWQGLSGDLVTPHKGERGLIAGDLIDAMSKADLMIQTTPIDLQHYVRCRTVR